MGAVSDIGKRLENAFAGVGDPFYETKKEIDSLLVQANRIPSMKILPTKAAYEIYTHGKEIATQALAAGNAFLNQVSTRYGLDPAFMKSVLARLVKTVNLNLVPYAPAIKSAVNVYNAGGQQYVTMPDVRFLTSVRMVLAESRSVFSAIVNQQAAKSWVWSLPGFQTFAAAAVGLRAAFDFVADVLGVLFKLPGQAFDLASKLVQMVFWGGLVYLGYELYSSRSGKPKETAHAR